MEKQTELGGNYVVIENGGYSIVTPSGSVELPNGIFWRMITEFCPIAMRGDIKFDDNFTWTEDSVTTK